MKVLGMGNALIDVLALIDSDKTLEKLGLPKGGMQLINKERFVAISQELEKLDTTVVSGGSAANTIVGLSYLDVPTAFIGSVGEDYYGNYFERELKDRNIKPYLIKGTELSGVASTFISKDGERTFGTYLGAASLIKSDDLKANFFADCEYFYVEGYLVQDYDLIINAMVMAKNAGAKVILDMASYNIVEENRDFLLDIMPQYVDIAFANEEEARMLYNADPEMAVSYLAEIVDIAVVKTGKTGSWIQSRNDKIFVPALDVHCVDSTGAGDLYASGFIYGLINSLSLKKCGMIGTCLAGEVIKSLGAKIEIDKWGALKKQIKEITN